MKPAESVQMNIYQRKPIEKAQADYISTMNQGSREAASEGPTVLHIHFYSLSNISK